MRFPVDDDCTIFKFNAALQLNDPVFSDVKQSFRKAKESVRNVFHDITYSSTADNLIELKSSEERTVKPMSKNSLPVYVLQTRMTIRLKISIASPGNKFLSKADLREIDGTSTLISTVMET